MLAHWLVQKQAEFGIGKVVYMAVRLDRSFLVNRHADLAFDRFVILH